MTGDKRRTFGLIGLGLAVTLASCADHASGPPSSFGADRETIVGGKADTMSRSIVVIAIGNSGLCSGTLILPNLVLTAHHCVSDMSGMGGVVACGMTTFSNPFPPSDFQVSWADSVNNAPMSSVYDVSAVRVPTDNDVCGNDIALLQLASNVPAAQAVPIEPRLDSEVETDEVFNAVGYGITNPNDMFGQTAGTRMRFDGATVLCVGAAECRGTGATATEWVGESPVCSGDSGGPALDKSNRVIGVVSRGPEECDMAVYSDVYSWRSLIVDAATDASDDGGYDPPGWVTGMPADGGAPVPDGGMMPDAGAGDAGPVMDAGAMMDAGTMDAGPMDAGPGDAGAPTDAGSMDAGGMVDGGGSGIDAGMSADAGAPMDAGAPVPDAGPPMMDASTTTSDGGPPDAAQGDPLGETCTSDCPGGYRCYADDGVPPGICVPPCQAGTKCPAGYECAEALGVCTRSSAEEDDSEPSQPAGCGCRTIRGSDAGDFGSVAWAFVLALATTLRRRAGARGGPAGTKDERATLVS